MFNSLKYAKILENAGVSRDQAEAHVQIVTEIMECTFATKQDLKELSTELRTEFKTELALKVQELQTNMQLLESRIVVKLGSLVVVAIGAALTFAKLLHI